MAKEFSSISRFGLYEPFELQVSRGQITAHRATHVFGFNPTVSTSLSTIWSGDAGLYVYPTSATVMKVSSSDANDTAAGTGARTLYIQGLDSNYNEIAETVTLNGQTAVDTTNSYLRVQRIDVLTAGSTGWNEGTVYVGTGTVTAGVPATKYSVANATRNCSLNSMFTVPAGYTAYIRNGSISTGSAVNNKYVTASLVARPLGGVFNTAAVTTLLNQQADYIFNYPIRLVEKTDLESRAVTTGDTFEVTTYYEIVLIANS